MHVTFGIVAKDVGAVERLVLQLKSLYFFLRALHDAIAHGLCAIKFNRHESAAAS
jgi:hypothetical protein